LEVLKQFKHDDGKVKVPELMQELFIQQYIAQGRLEKGVERFESIDNKLDRCPVLAGQKTWEDAHAGFAKTEAMPPTDKIKVSGILSWTAVKWFLVFIAAISSGGVAVALIAKVGGLP